ncbi:RluA family pseudouridine synthase [Buchnera aphidicola]|uniref:RluA family pseudouridine synthase n=1 Tax=Buchnera aphidicola TaxID=9 RepID=UPI0031B882DE
MIKKKNEYTKVKKIVILKNSIGQRIDNFLKKKLKKFSKNAIYTIIRKGRIRINKKRIQAKYKLKKNDTIRIPPIYKESKKIVKKKNIPYFKKIIKNNILYEDKYLMAINKPKKIAVHGGSGINFGIIEMIRKIYPMEKNLELIHRLDKDTSGVLLISKKKFVLKSLHNQIKNRRIKKTYTAIVHGLWPIKYKKINFPLLKTQNIFGKRLVLVSKNGKKSKTIFKVEKKYKNATILKIYPITGRTHQIRVHTAQIGHPIINDNRYGNKNLDKKINIKNKELFLHALQICFLHPKTNKKISIIAKKNSINTLNLKKIFN